MEYDKKTGKSISKIIYIADKAVRNTLKEELEKLYPEEIREEAYCEYLMRFKNEKRNLTIKQFQNGKLQIQGSTGNIYNEISDVIKKVVGFEEESESKSSNVLMTSNTFELEIKGTQIGSDESGKGDFFGPLVIAAVWVDDEKIKILKELGVKDCKKISDSKCIQIANKIRELDKTGFVELVLTPEKYNEIYYQFRAKNCSLNQMLGYLHAKVICRLAERHLPKTIIIDKFGKEDDVMRNLGELNKETRIIQATQGERNIAVAAASILARDRFISSIKSISDETGISLPLGASIGVIEAGKQIVKQKGRDYLKYCAKLHFKTIDKL